MSERQTLRRYFRAQRRALSPQVQQQHALAVTHALLRSTALLSARRIGFYLATDGEVDLTPLARRLHRRGVILAMPVVGKSSDMDFYAFDPNERLVCNRFGIAEPPPSARFVNGRSLSLLLMPLVAFDARCARLGMGAGFYDRYLAKLGPLRPKTIGIAHEVQRSDRSLPQAPWDIPLDAVVTEAGWQHKA